MRVGAARGMIPKTLFQFRPPLPLAGEGQGGAIFHKLAAEEPPPQTLPRKAEREGEKE